MSGSNPSSSLEFTEVLKNVIDYINTLPPDSKEHALFFNSLFRKCNAIELIHLRWEIATRLKNLNDAELRTVPVNSNPTQDNNDGNGNGNGNGPKEQGKDNRKGKGKKSSVLQESRSENKNGDKSPGTKSQSSATSKDDSNSKTQSSFSPYPICKIPLKSLLRQPQKPSKERKSSSLLKNIVLMGKEESSDLSNLEGFDMKGVSLEDYEYDTTEDEENIEGNQQEGDEANKTDVDVTQKEVKVQEQVEEESGSGCCKAQCSVEEDESRASWEEQCLNILNSIALHPEAKILWKPQVETQLEHQLELTLDQGIYFVDTAYDCLREHGFNSMQGFNDFMLELFATRERYLTPEGKQVLNMIRDEYSDIYEAIRLSEQV